MEEDELDTRMERAPVGACLSSLPISLSLSSLNWFTSEDSVETFDGMKAAIPRLRKKLGADPDYFRRVYLYTFDFAQSEGQRRPSGAFWSTSRSHLGASCSPLVSRAVRSDIALLAIATTTL